MKRINHVWPNVTTFENLYFAYLLARKGKQSRTEVAIFSANLEQELTTLESQLKDQSYKFGPYRKYTIYEKKPRVIAVAPFRDRVVQHAVMRHIEPAIDARFIYHSYACRKGKGAHRAIRQYQQWANQYSYAIKLDIVKYFASIKHRILIHQLQCMIKDQSALKWFSALIDTYPNNSIKVNQGLPVGNLSSQVCANLYLNGLDHYVLHHVKPKAYLRYVDDMVLLANSKQQLWEMVNMVEEWLSENCQLRVHQHNKQVQPTSVGLPLLGFQVFRHKIRLNTANRYRFERKLRSMSERYATGRNTLQQINASVNGWIGHSRHADSRALREKIFENVTFKRVRP